MSHHAKFALPFSIALSAILSLAGAPALGQVCLPVPADTSPPPAAGVSVIAPPDFDDANEFCCQPYESSSASNSCRDEAIEMVQFGTNCSVDAECLAPPGLYGFVYRFESWWKATSITVPTGNVDDLSNCKGNLTNGNC